MKKAIGAAAAIACMLLLTPSTAPPTHAAVDVSFNMFYSDLSPHGSWLVSGSYGRVWQPRVYQRGWNPYYDGHWQYADVGWVWVSDYEWGSIPYHYGTWVDDPQFGWVWVPGYTWAPAWVVFRTGPSAIGWAPVAPGFSLSVSLGGGYYEPPNSAFIFVPTREFAAPRIRPYVVSQRQTNVYIQNTTVVRNNLTVQNNIVVNRGPDVRVIERASGRQLRPEPVERVQHVAPFAGFNRQQMTVRQEPGRAIRAAEPVPERTPLPDSGSRANNQTPQQPRRGFPQDQQPQPQQQQRERQQQPQPQQQQREQQSPRPQQERQVLPQPIPPDEPRPLPHPRPTPPRPPVQQPPPRMEPDHNTPHATPPQQKHGDQHQQQAQPQQQQQPQQKKSTNNKKKPKEPPPHQDQQSGGTS